MPNRSQKSAFRRWLNEGSMLYLQAFHQPSELCPGYWLEFILIARPLVLSAFKPFVEEDETVFLPHESLDAVSLSAAEQEQCRLEWIHIEALLYKCSKAIDGLSHVCVSAGYVYLINNGDVT